MKVKHIVRGVRVSVEKARQARKNRRLGTAEENTMWRKLKDNQVGGFHFRRQQVIRGFIVDFYCSQAGLVIEVDADGHQSTEAYDREREDVLSALGLRVIRFRNREVRDRPEEVISTILRECRR